MRACVPPRPCVHMCVCAHVCMFVCMFLYVVVCVFVCVLISLLVRSTSICAYVQYIHMLSVCDYVCVRDCAFGSVQCTYIQMYMCLPGCMCARVCDR